MSEQTSKPTKKRPKCQYPTRIYQYDVDQRRMKPEELAYIDSQLRLCRLYRNRLIERERDRRSAYGKLCANFFPTYSTIRREQTDADEAIETIRAGMRQENQERCETRRRLKEERQELDVAKARKKAADKSMATLRVEMAAHKGFQTAVANLNTEYNKLHKQDRRWANKELGLFSFSCNGVEDSLRGLRSGQPPQFKKWDGSGRLCCQIQRNAQYPQSMTWEYASLGTDSRLRIREEQMPAHDHEKRFHVVSVRLGSVGKQKKPLFVDLPILCGKVAANSGKDRARLPPPDAVITNAWLIRERLSIRSDRAAPPEQSLHRTYQYKLCLVVSRPDGFAKPDLAKAGACGIDVNYAEVTSGHTLVATKDGLQWQDSGPGVRVAYWVGDDGQFGNLTIPQRWVDYARKAGLVRNGNEKTGLQKDREDLFNAMKGKLAAFIQGLPAVPAWLEATRKSLGLLRNHHTLLNVVNTWKPIDGDAEIVAAMRLWRHKELHLARWEAAQRRKFAAYRKHLYRSFWAWLRRRYAVAYVEKLNVAAMRKSAHVENGKTPRWAVKNRNIASIGMFVSLATMPTAKVPAPYTSSTCRKCRGRLKLDGSRTHTCEHCGATFDRDYNAASNILASGQVMYGNLVPARETKEATEPAVVTAEPSIIAPEIAPEALPLATQTTGMLW